MKKLKMPSPTRKKKGGSGEGSPTRHSRAGVFRRKPKEKGPVPDLPEPPPGQWTREWHPSHSHAPVLRDWLMCPGDDGGGSVPIGLSAAPHSGAARQSVGRSVKNLVPHIGSPFKKADEVKAAQKTNAAAREVVRLTAARVLVLLSGPWRPRQRGRDRPSALQPHAHRACVFCRATA